MVIAWPSAWARSKPSSPIAARTCCSESPKNLATTNAGGVPPPSSLSRLMIPNSLAARTGSPWRVVSRRASELTAIPSKVALSGSDRIATASTNPSRAASASPARKCMPAFDKMFSAVRTLSPSSRWMAIACSMASWPSAGSPPRSIRLKARPVRSCATRARSSGSASARASSRSCPCRPKSCPMTMGTNERSNRARDNSRRSPTSRAMSTELPEAPDRGADPERGLRIPHRLRPVEGCSHVVVVLLETFEPLALRLAHQVRLGLLGQTSRGGGVPAADLVLLARGRQPLAGELVDRLEHPEPRFPRGGLAQTDQAVVDKGVQSVEHLDVETGTGHPLCGLQRPAAPERREASEQPLHFGFQEVVAPFDRSTEGSLTPREVARAPGEQREAPAEPFDERPRAQHLHPAGRELDRQGEAIEPSDDLRDGHGVAFGEAELATDGGRSLDEQHDGLARREGLELRTLRIWERERSDQILVLAGEMEGHSTGGQKAEARGRVEEAPHLRGGVDDLLDVVQHQQ